jgi:hypothetical protein
MRAVAPKKKKLYCLIVLPFLFGIWRIQRIWAVVDLLRRNPHWWSTTVSSTCGLTLRVRYRIKFAMKLIAMIFRNNYYCQFYRPSWKSGTIIRFLPLMKQFFLTPNRINEVMHPITRPPSVIIGQVANERTAALLYSAELDNDYYDVLLLIRRKIY